MLISLAFLAFAGMLADLAHEKGVATDLHSLSGGGENLIGALAAKSSGEIRVLCADEERAAKCRAAFPFRETPEPSQLLGYFLEHAGGLLAEKTRALLKAGEYDKIRRSVTRRDYSGIGLFSKADDPYYFLSDYVASLKSLMPKGFSEGQVLLTASAKGDDGRLAQLIALADSDDGISIGGAPFHTFLATEKSKREINILGGVSLAVILLLGLFLFRSFSFVLPTLATLAFGYLAGATAVFAFFPQPHILTFLFGSTLIGLGVDYCYHSFSTDGILRRSLVRNMTAALATTGLAFAPLLFSPVAVLNQMAAFTIAGLVAIWGIAATGKTRIAPHCVKFPAAKPRPGKFLGWVALSAYLAMLLAAGRGVGLLRRTNDPSHFYSPPPVLAKGEMRIAEIVGGVSAFAVVSAPTFEEALQKEEAIGACGLSRLVPSLKRQQENFDLVKKFCEANGAPPSLPPQFVTLDSLPPSLRTLADAMILAQGGMTHLISPAGENAPNAVAKISPKAELEKMFARFSAQTVILVHVSFAAMAVALLAIYRRRFMEYFEPVVLSAFFTAGTLGWLGEQVTFFHGLCFFVMAGVGIDYVIFLKAHGWRASSPAQNTVVLVSFLTSLAGFGALGFTSFPPTRAMGRTLAIGLLFCYLFSLLEWKFHEAKAAAKPSDWSKQKEKGASRLGILVIWHIYRIFGKAAAKIAFLVPLAFIAPFCRGVGWRKLLAFAWSRIDIVDAVTLRKNIPRFTFSGDSSWREGGAFLISSHLGSIEVLAALCDESRPRLHAFQQMTHDPIFTRFLTERMNGFALHAVEDIGVDTAVEMQDAIRRGELVLMAGDRLPASGGARRRNETRTLLGREREWPAGVFRFARLMESPVYAIAAVQTGWNSYEIKANRLDGDLLDGYVAFLETECRRHPEQWFQFV